MQTLKSLIYLGKTVVKFRNLEISKILSTNTNRIFPIPFKVVYIFLRYTQFDSKLIQLLVWVEPKMFPN